MENRDATGTQRDWVLNLYVVKSYGMKWLLFEKWSLITYGEQNQPKKEFSPNMFRSKLAFDKDGLVGVFRHRQGLVGVSDTDKDLSVSKKLVVSTTTEKLKFEE